MANIVYVGTTGSIKSGTRKLTEEYRMQLTNPRMTRNVNVGPGVRGVVVDPNRPRARRGQ